MINFFWKLIDPPKIGFAKRFDFQKKKAKELVIDKKIINVIGEGIIFIKLNFSNSPQKTD